MKCIVLLALLALVAFAAISVDAAPPSGAGDRLASLKSRVAAMNSASQSLHAQMPKLRAHSLRGKKPCAKGPTLSHPVHEHGVKDQLPGDREANEALISRVDGEIEVNEAYVIKEKHIRDARQLVRHALNVQDNFHQQQAKVLRETTLPRDPR